MRIYDYAMITPDERRTILNRSNADIFNRANIDGIRAIYEEVRRDGDAAVVAALERFDHVVMGVDEIQASPEEIEQACKEVPHAVQDAIAASIHAVRRYNERLMQGGSWLEELAPGMLLGEKSSPIERVGLYVPSNKGTFPSVLVQLATPALVAGVKEIAVVMPPAMGHGKRLDQACLVAAHQLGISEVYRANGPAGIAAMAIGTQTIRRVRKIAGPGSPAVQAAQILAQLEGVAVSMLFGPSESLILADDSADPRVLAADFLNEAEHGLDSASILVTPSRALVEAVQREAAVQLAALPEWRRAYAESATTKYGGAIITRDLDEAIDFANEYGAEHMQVATREPLFVLGRLHNAGEILLGQNTPVSAANFAIGVPAALPTGGFSAVSSGVTVNSFLKRTSIAYLDRQALADMAGTVLALAEHEGFPQHAATIHIRGLGDQDSTASVDVPESVDLTESV